MEPTWGAPSKWFRVVPMNVAVAPVVSIVTSAQAAAMSSGASVTTTTSPADADADAAPPPDAAPAAAPDDAGTAGCDAIVVVFFENWIFVNPDLVRWRPGKGRRQS